MKGEKYLDDWVERMRATGNKHLVKVANTVMAFCSGILSWYDHRISNGKVEGINNKIKGSVSQSVSEASSLKPVDLR